MLCVANSSISFFFFLFSFFPGKISSVFCLSSFSHIRCNYLQMLPPTGWLVSPFPQRNMFTMFSLFMDLSPRLCRFWLFHCSIMEVMVQILMLSYQILKGVIVNILLSLECCFYALPVIYSNNHMEINSYPAPLCIQTDLWWQFLGPSRNFNTECVNHLLFSPFSASGNPS